MASLRVDLRSGSTVEYEREDLTDGRDDAYQEISNWHPGSNPEEYLFTHPSNPESVFGDSRCQRHPYNLYVYGMRPCSVGAENGFRVLATAPAPLGTTRQ
jgi:hypothetical protein